MLYLVASHTENPSSMGVTVIRDTNTNLIIGQDPSSIHLEYLHQYESMWAQNLYTLVDIIITIAVFLLCKVVRKVKAKNGLCHGAWKMPGWNFNRQTPNQIMEHWSQCICNASQPNPNCHLSSCLLTTRINWLHATKINVVITPTMIQRFMTC